ncbi:Transcription factor atf21 [Fusarium oxysporum f. sp. albedinis]|nr:Transcription factor atf21 [Fusarium oxysporum f. sp. albedinis]
MLISFICAIDISLFIYAFLDNQNLDYGARTRQVRSSSYTTLIGIFYSTDLNTATRNDDAHCSNRVGVRYKQVRYRLVPLEIQL